MPAIALIVNAVDPATDAPVAYVRLKVMNMNPDSKAASCYLDLYTTQSAYQNGKDPLSTLPFELVDGVDAGNGTVVNLYSDYVGAPLDATAKPVSQNMDDLIQAQGLVALQHHPLASAFLAGATITT